MMPRNLGFSRSSDVLPRHATFEKSSTGRPAAQDTVQRCERPSNAMVLLVGAQEAKGLPAHKVVVSGQRICHHSSM